MSSARLQVWPFPDRALLKIIRDNKHLRQIVVCEHNDGQMLLEVQRVVEGRVPVDFLGKIDGTTLTPTEILAKTRRCINMPSQLIEKTMRVNRLPHIWCRAADTAF